MVWKRRPTRCRPRPPPRRRRWRCSLSSGRCCRRRRRSRDPGARSRPAPCRDRREGDRPVLPRVHRQSPVSRPFRTFRRARSVASNSSTSGRLGDVSSLRRRKSGGVEVTQNSAPSTFATCTLQVNSIESPGRSSATVCTAACVHLSLWWHHKVTRCAFPSPTFDTVPTISSQSPRWPGYRSSPAKSHSAIGRFHHALNTVAAYVRTAIAAAIHDEIVPQSIGRTYPRELA